MKFDYPSLFTRLPITASDGQSFLVGPSEQELLSVWSLRKHMTKRMFLRGAQCTDKEGRCMA